MWPVPDSPYYGIFVKEQVEALEKYYPEVNNKVYFINGKSNKLNYLWSIFKINWLFLFNKYDVVHIHYALSGLFLLINPFIKIPVLTTLHGSDFNSQNSIVKKLIRGVLKKSTDIVYLNEEMLNTLKHYNKRMHHIPCGVDTELFKPNRKSYNHNEISIAFPSSRLRPEKNYAFFEEIINVLRYRHNHKINIIEINNKTREQVNSILNSVDLLCMTSLTEGSPQIIKEAMCCNTPIVSSNVGDVKVLLEKVDNTFVIDSYEVQIFFNSFIQILNLSMENRRSNGRKRVFELGIDEKTTSKKLLQAYFSKNK